MSFSNKINITLDKSTHTLLTELKQRLDSPSISSTIYFLAKQNNALPLTEQVTIAPKTYAFTLPEQRALPPLHTIQIGNDTYQTLQHTKELHGLRSWDASIQRYLYKPKVVLKDDPDTVIIQLQKEVATLKEELSISRNTASHLNTLIQKIKQSSTQ